VPARRTANNSLNRGGREAASFFANPISRNTSMTPCNYVPIETSHIDQLSPYFEDLLDLDVLCTEEGIFINLPKTTEEASV
jgi:hypothetical protein